MSPVDQFRRQQNSFRRGRAAEYDGIAWLQDHGYLVLESNVRFRLGEIDVVALDGETLCFIEIKARSGDLCGDAAYAVTSSKQRQLVRLASLYLSNRPHDGPTRFDVLAMDGEKEGWRYTLFRDAFEAY